LLGGGLLSRLAPALLAALVVWTPTGLAQQSRPAARELTEFIRTLSALRAGDQTVSGQLLEQAEILCVDFARCDTLAVARYYLSLNPADLAQGLQAEQSYLATRRRVVLAGRGELPEGSDWPTERAALYAELAALAAVVEEQGDVVPAAQSYALLARLELSALEQNLDWSGERSQQLFGLVSTHVDRSLALFERAGQVTPRLEPLWLSGKLARVHSELGRAQGIFEDCLKLARDVGRVEYQERALKGLVALARDAGDLREVDEYLASWARLVSPSDSWDLAREHATRLLADDRAESALAFLASNAPTQAAQLSQWRGLLAVGYLRTGDRVSARREILALGSESSTVNSLARAALALVEGNPKLVRELLGNSEQRAHWSAQRQVEAAALIGESWLDSGQPSKALPHLQGALEVARQRGRLVDDGSGSIVGEWVGLHAVTLLARAHAELGDPLAAAQVIEDNQSRRLRPAESRLSIEELRTWASRFDRGLVTFAVSADFTVVVWIDASGRATASTRPLGRRSLQGAVRRLREAVISGDLQRARSLGQEIAAALLPSELLDHLGTGNPDERALFLLHGPLEALPITLLGVNGDWLDERLTPLVLPGLPLGEAADPLTADADWNLMGSPLGGENREALLPGAARELAQLSRMHSTASLYTGTAFVRSALLAAMEGEQPLHVATHLVRAPDCGQGRLAPVGLLLSDGDVFCSEEILRVGPRLPLVVLAACETAGGRTIDAEGAHGVARAFLEAGTRDLLVTLWPISDSAAQAFAEAYHGNLKTGFDPAAAAQMARKHLRDLGYGPQDWAAFRAMGRE